MTITLDTVRAAAQRLGAAADVSRALAAALQARLQEAVRPIYAASRDALDAAAEEQAAAERELRAMLEANPGLFAKSPRSIVVNGVRAGYRRSEDALDWDSDDVVIARIRNLRPDLADVCIRTADSIVVDALSQLDARTLTSLGVRRITGTDAPVITIGASDADSLVKAILSAAIQRQGEDDKPKGAKKGKAKAKAAEKETA